MWLEFDRHKKKIFNLYSLNIFLIIRDINY